MPKDERAVAQVFAKYGYHIPKPWVERRQQFNPKRNCFAYIPKIDDKEEQCQALNRLYCKYEEKCNFFKKYKLRGLDDEYQYEEEI